MRGIVYYIVFAFTTTLLSCGGTTQHIASGDLPGKEAYEMAGYAGCCGCQAKYVTLYTGKQKTEQIVYSYNCPSAGTPTKFVFNYSKSGKMIGCDKYVATTGDDFTMPLTDNEKKVLATADPVKYTGIRGFRKPADRELSHPFPLIKKGYKLPVK